MLRISLLKNLPADTSTPPTLSASAFLAVPISLGSSPPKNIEANSVFSVSFAGVATLSPALIVAKPLMLTLGVNESLETIATGWSAIYKIKILFVWLSESAMFSTAGP